MLYFPMWKKLLIWGICFLGVLLAFPNFSYERVERFNDAQTALEMGAPADPAALEAWPSFLPSTLVNLGLDLRGGAHLLVEVAVEDVYQERMDGMWPAIRSELRDIREQVGAVRQGRVDGHVMEVHIENPDGLQAAIAAIRTLARPVVTLTGVGTNDIEISGTGSVITVEMSEAERIATDTRTMEQSLEIIRRRVDEAGTREPTIQRQGDRRILVQVPGIGSAEEVLTLIGKTAKLTFHPVESRASSADQRAGAGNIILPSLEDPNEFYIVKRRPVISGDHLVDATPSFDQNGQPAVNFRLNPTGRAHFR